MPRCGADTLAPLSAFWHSWHIRHRDNTGIGTPHWDCHSLRDSHRTISPSLFPLTVDSGGPWHRHRVFYNSSWLLVPHFDSVAWQLAMLSQFSMAFSSAFIARHDTSYAPTHFTTTSVSGLWQFSMTVHSDTSLWHCHSLALTDATCSANRSAKSGFADQAKLAK